MSEWGLAKALLKCPICWREVEEVDPRTKICDDCMALWARLPMRKPALRGAMRFLGKKSNGRCWYCGTCFTPKQRPTRDHLVPKCRGGLSVGRNLVLACGQCNSSKRDMSLEVYRRHLQHKRGGERVMFYGETCA